MEGLVVVSRPAPQYPSFASTVDLSTRLPSLPRIVGDLENSSRTRLMIASDDSESAVKHINMPQEMDVTPDGPVGDQKTSTTDNANARSQTNAKAPSRDAAFLGHSCRYVPLCKMRKMRPSRLLTSPPFFKQLWNKKHSSVAQVAHWCDDMQRLRALLEGKERC